MWNKARYLPTIEWIKNMWDAHLLYSQLLKMKSLSSAEIRMKPKDIIPKEMSAQNDRYPRSSHT